MNKVRPSKMQQMTHIRQSWRDYQKKLQRTATLRRFLRKTCQYMAVVPVLLLAGYGIVASIGSSACQHIPLNVSIPPNNKTDITHIKADSYHNHTETSRVEADCASDKEEIRGTNQHILKKKEIQAILDSRTLTNPKDKSFEFVFDGRNLKVDTSLDIDLQEFILKKINRTTTSRYIGFVAIDPSTGKVLSMAGFDKIDSSHNPCVENVFPAASIFKIVTAAAAIEKCGFNPASCFTFNGRKHTLYKGQLKEKRNRYTNKISLRDAFAQSINPVFGKIGSRYLKKEMLETYALSFGFNHHIDFEIPLAPSLISIKDDPYQWAEIASGFNRETLISPLHGALLSASLSNKGMLVEPTVIDRITDEKGNILYRSQFSTVHRALAPEASKAVKKLMMATIKSGTCRKAFRGYHRDRILSKLNIGGKTGTIDNKAHDARYDWFVGFAEEKKGEGKIAIAVLVAHEKYIGTRASQYARIAMKHYFSNYFAKNNSKKIMGNG